MIDAIKLETSLGSHKESVKLISKTKSAIENRKSKIAFICGSIASVFETWERLIEI
jgi:hypothetical protein